MQNSSVVRRTVRRRVTPLSECLSHVEKSAQSFQSMLLVNAALVKSGGHIESCNLDISTKSLYSFCLLKIQFPGTPLVCIICFQRVFLPRSGRKYFSPKIENGKHISQIMVNQCLQHSSHHTAKHCHSIPAIDVTLNIQNNFLQNKIIGSITSHHEFQSRPIEAYRGSIRC